MLNGIMIQFFHWYCDQDLWNELKEEAPKLAKLGVSAVWVPPAYKGMAGRDSRGYDLYDLYDLGEFDQKGHIKTRYGSKEEYLGCIKALQENGITVVGDTVLNHMGGADEKEKIWVKKVDPENRNEFISEAYEIEAYTKFTFPGRKGKYSKFIWDHRCFTGVDYDESNKENAIFSIQNEYGEGWDEVMDLEKGNFDYLMCCDIEHRNPAVKEELKRWGEWYLKTTEIHGLRLDAIKHISPKFILEFVKHLQSIKSDLFIVGEYWAPDNLPLMQQYIEATERQISLFDAPLHHNFYEASKQGRDYDLTTILNNSLVEANPEMSVTILDNHDTQPLQTLEKPVDAWFRPLGYSIILLREKGYPCIFYPDLYGATYSDKGSDGNEYEVFLAKCNELEALLIARKEFAYGIQRDYLDHPNCIGWTREGKEDEDSTGCAVMLSNGEDGNKFMEVGKRHANKTFVDLLQIIKEEIKIDENGCGEFLVKGGQVSVWVQKDSFQKVKNIL